MRRSSSGFTFFELAVATVVFAVAGGALPLVFINCLSLNMYSRQLTTAVNEAQATIEEISNYNFDTIATDYSSTGTPGNTFSITNWAQNHSGIIEIDDTDESLLVVTVTVCWESKGGRIVGEDNNLDGTFTAFSSEDENNNGRLDSPAQLITLVTRH